MLMTNSEESGIGYRKMHLTLLFFAQILHSTPYFFIIVFPSAFYDRSRMTGRYLILLCKNRFFSFTHSYFHSSVSAHSCPFRRLTPPLSPTSGDSLRFAFFILSFFRISKSGLSSLFFLLCTHLASEHHGKTKTPLPRHSWAAGRIGMMMKGKPDYDS